MSSREGLLDPAPSVWSWSWSRRLCGGPLLVRVHLTKPEREDAGFIAVLWKVLGTRVGRPSKGDGPAQRKVQGKRGVTA